MDATNSTNYYTRVTEITKADTYHLEKQNKGKKTVKWKKNCEVPAELGVKSVQYVIQTVKESGSDGPDDCLHPGNS